MTPEQARQARRLEYPVLAAVLLTIPALILHSAHAGGVVGLVSDVLNWGIWLVFLAEFVIMLRIAPDNRVWARHNLLDIFVLVLTPPFLPDALQFLWVLRLLRIVDLLPIFGRVFQVNGFRYAGMLAFLAVLGGGLAFAELEEGQGVNGFDGVWWAMTTISTVGYGDLYPKTSAGRVLGMSLMFVGPILIGLVASSMGQLLQREIEEDIGQIQEGVEELEEDVSEIEADVGEVEEDVAGLSETDRRILGELRHISRRLDALEASNGVRAEERAARRYGPS